MSKYVMALDQGTTSSRCILFNKNGEPQSIVFKEFKQYYPNPGWVSHDAEEIWDTQITVARQAMEKIGATAADIAAIGITNQRETTVIWDRATGKPIDKAIVWQCRRSAGTCDSLRAKGLADPWCEKTGLVIDAYFSATKVKWLLDNVPGAREKAEKGELAFGTIDTWLIWNLTKGKVHATDYSNASRTMMFNINDLKWDDDILKELDIPKSLLPEAKPSSGLFGEADASWFGAPIKITGDAGDQQAALFGQTCFNPGELKNTYGTACCMLMNTGEKRVASKNGLLTTIAWGVDGKVEYALEGSIFMGGASVQWIRDEVKLVEKAPDTEAAALAVEDTGGVYLVPAHVGLGAPYWDSYARAAFHGMTRGTNRNHLIRATLEAIAYQVYDVMQAMSDDAGVPIASLRVDGGASANNFLMQFQADIMGKTVLRPVCTETTALGAAYLAGLAVGYWGNKSEIVANWQVEKQFDQSMPQDKVDKLLAGWKKALDRSFKWEDA